MKLVIKLLYKPFGLVMGLTAGLVAGRVYRATWRKVDDREPPSARIERTTWSKVVGAAALEAVTFSVTRAVADRAGAKAFSHLFGLWPGEREAELAE